ncbi:hypothetical protein Trco_001081 [Trichoderma cornu-damae]|uniref:Uncharacterized protein n=1 Tax=Trichoderma cornu-damae TaxID=654480 RepID=A0A9P8TWY2_9HYPO|nr:hypothetical protein Trco_001081 [Trichoderma cornu-damae]
MLFSSPLREPRRSGSDPSRPSTLLARDQDTPLSIKTASSLGRAGLGPRTDASHSRQISWPDVQRGGNTDTRPTDALPLRPTSKPSLDYAAKSCGILLPAAHRSSYAVALLGRRLASEWRIAPWDAVEPRCWASLAIRRLRAAICEA